MKKLLLALCLLASSFTRAQIISTVAGNGTEGYSNAGGAATAAELDRPYGIAVDGAGNIYISNFVGCRIEKVSTSGIITLLAGGSGISGFSGDGGPATAAMISNPWGIAVDAAGNVYFADAGNNRIREINTSGIISTIAGNGSTGNSGDGGSATAASIGATDGLYNPDIIGVAVDASGNVYFSDFWGSVVRMISTVGTITTVAGTGSGGFSGDGGQATGAMINEPYGLAVDGSGNIFIADYGNNRIREISTSGIIATIGGTGVGGFSGDGGQATAAKLKLPTSVAVDASGTVYIADCANNRIRKINAAGVISTIAGNGVGSQYVSGYGDGGAATSAEFYYPQSVAVGASGDVYFTDQYGERVRAVGCSALSPIGGANTVCTGNSAVVTAPISGGIWTSGATGTATINSGGTIYGITAGTVTIDYTKVGCTATKTMTVNANTLPSITGPNAVCVGAGIVMSNATSGGTWSISNTSLASIISTTGAITGIAVGTEAVSYTLSTGCYKTMALTVNNTYPAGITGSAFEICAGGLHTTLANATSGGSWSSSSPATASVVSSTGVVSGSVAGTTTISYTKTGCSATQVVTVNPNTMAAITGTMSVCTGQITTLANATSGGTWSSANTSFATINAGTGVVTGLSAGMDYITYTAGYGCYKTSIFYVYTPITTPITGTAEICAGGIHTTLTNATTGGLWSSSAASTASIGSTTGIVSGLLAGTATITYTKSGCSTTQVVTVDANPLSANTGTAIVCAGNTTTLANSTAGGTWSSNNLSLATVGSTTGIVTGVSSGSDYITYTYGSGCYKTSSVTIGAPITTAITGTTEICAGGIHATLANATTGGIWSSSSSTTASVGSTTGIVSGLAAGTANISYTKSGCSIIQAITVDANPLSVNTGTAVVCTGSTTTLANSTAGGMWSSSNTALATVGSASGVVTGVSSGSDYITYTYGAGCYKMSSLTIHSPATTISGSGSLCTGATATFVDGTTGGTWSSSAATKASVGASTGVVTGVAAGTATISYSISGCPVTTFPVVVGACARMGDDENSGATANPVDENSYILYPNPADKEVIIASEMSLASNSVLDIFDITGKKVSHQEMNGAELQATFNTSTLKDGIYFVKIFNNTAAPTTLWKRFVVAH